MQLYTFAGTCFNAVGFHCKKSSCNGFQHPSVMLDFFWKVISRGMWLSSTLIHLIQLHQFVEVSGTVFCFGIHVRLQAATTGTPPPHHHHHHRITLWCGSVDAPEPSSRKRDLTEVGLHCCWASKFCQVERKFRSFGAASCHARPQL